ncbi:unnamed protein product [Euphydryas editha]|uniref:Secreted protein n=1 Tax=Euphydryas editha TaxID=104508 RepID=A0AAU9UZD8_EUPED|nr:unnamed protein product [Euphydryas editha]
MAMLGNTDGVAVAAARRALFATALWDTMCAASYPPRLAHPHTNPAFTNEKRDHYPLIHRLSMVIAIATHVQCKSERDRCGFENYV